MKLIVFFQILISLFVFAFSATLSRSKRRATLLENCKNDQQCSSPNLKCSHKKCRKTSNYQCTGDEQCVTLSCIKQTDRPTGYCE